VATLPIGLLNVNKPAGITSRAVVDRVERLVRPAKAGHAGTLDPLATGVLVICVGQATKLIRFVQQMPKRYHATFLLGRQSETDDIEGDVLEIENAIAPARSAIESVLPRFIGSIEQRPPAHSAIKIAGRRAYALARRGKPVDLAPRTVTVHRLEIRRYEYPDLELEIECGSGTYVRALGRDIAATLGTACVMSSLVRTRIGLFRVEEAVAFDEIAQNIAAQLQPALAAVPDLPRVTLSDAELTEIGHGRPITSPDATQIRTHASDAEWAATNPSGQLVAILRERQSGQLWPACNLG
jgi:tRNA pseudouridine55 synthase